MTVSRRPTVRLLCAALAIVAASAPAAGDDETGAPDAGGEASGDLDEIEDILTNPLDNGAYTDESRCISSFGSGQIEVVDDRNLVFEGRQNRLWWNRLRQRCLGLKSDMRLTMERRSWRFCARDRFRGFGRTSADLPSTICELGNFVELDREAAELLRTAIKASKRNAAVDSTIRQARK